MPEVEHAVGVAALEARAEHNVGLSFEYGLKEFRIFLRIVFEVCVLNDDEVARRRRKSSA